MHRPPALQLPQPPSTWNLETSRARTFYLDKRRSVSSKKMTGKVACFNTRPPLTTIKTGHEIDLWNIVTESSDLVTGRHSQQCLTRPLQDQTRSVSTDYSRSKQRLRTLTHLPDVRTLGALQRGGRRLRIPCNPVTEASEIFTPRESDSNKLKNDALGEVPTLILIITHNLLML